jgi:hypothetical protein
VLNTSITEHRGNHVDHGGALVVGDGVEHLFHLLSVLDGHNHRVRRLQRVQAQGVAEATRGELLPHLVLWEQRVGAEVLHPGGEALVEPQAVPPGHGDQIAEPLVRQLVCDDHGDALLLLRAGGGLVDHQRHLAVGNQAPVLHGAHGELGDADHVQLGQRVGHLWKG